MILVIETSHTPGSVAIAPSPDRSSWIQRVFPPGLVHGRELFPHIDHLVTAVGGAPNEITTIAVSAGPGSYTGVRIGVAAAKGLAWALRVPVIAVSTLEVIARNVPNDVTSEFAVILDARRGHCYGARFRWQDEQLLRLSDDGCLPPAAFLQGVSAGTLLVGEGAKLFGTSSPKQQYLFGDEEWNVPQALGSLHSVAHFGKRLWQPRSAHSLAAKVSSELSQDVTLPVEYTDPHRLLPNYMRPSEAEERVAAREESSGRAGKPSGRAGKPSNAADTPKGNSE